MAGPPTPPVPRLIDRVALKLSGSDGNHIGTATLISPSIAITSAQLVENHQEYHLEGLDPGDLGGRDLFSGPASVIARDDQIGFAALELEPNWHRQPMFPFAEEPARGSSWETVYFPPYGKIVKLSGTAQETEDVGVQSKQREYFFRKLLRLSPLYALDDYSGVAGAPVMVDDLLVGLMTEKQFVRDLYAIPLTEIMKSPAWKVVEAAMQSSSATETKDEQPIGQFRVTAAGLNLRQGPNTVDAVLTVLFARSVVEKLGESADQKWFRVRTLKDGAPVEGWVAARFLQPTDGTVGTASALNSEQFDTAAFLKRLSGSSVSALAHANGMRIAPRLPKMHMEHLIAGLFQKKGGPTRNEFQRVGIDRDQLSELVVTEVNTVLPPESSYTPIFITDELPPVSAHVEQALMAAAALANESASELIRTRHLIRGALAIADCSVIKALLRHGVDPNNIQLKDKPAPEPAKRRPTQAGIKSDDLEGNDLLDIENEVETLCTVLASTYVKPPISLGLFGDWGSGKSFFMKKMEARFNQLQQIARDEDSAYCKNIVQLWFNAWHYMDTNLWASLATQIFDELAQALARQAAITAGKDPDYERAQLVAKKAGANEAVARAEQKKLAADAKVRATEQQLASIQSGETAVALSPQDVLREGYRFARQQPEVGKLVVAADQMIDDKVQEAAAKLNLEGDPTAVREQLLELRGLWGYARAIWLAVRNAKSKWLWLLSAVFLLIAAGVVLLPLAPGQTWIHSASLRLATIALSLLAAVAPFVPAATRALQIIHGAIKSSQESIEKARLEAEKRLQSQHQQLQEIAIEAQDTLDRAVEDARDWSNKLDNLRADRQMSNFIKQRQQSSDYTRYLGVIAKARNDFEQLSTLLAKEQKRADQEQKNRRKKAQIAKANVDGQRAAPEDECLLPRIDRIILYIDDLDRCPEDKVVDVLQAVHLLLAFPLFVVVVGVDPRWLLHSLRQHSKAFQSQTENDESSEEERTRWRSTPLNYLEKIFQIPFTLRPMGESGFGKMIDTLTKPPEDQQQANEESDKSETALTEIARQSVATPPTAATETVAPPPVDGQVAEKPAAVSAEPAHESWTTKFFGFLTGPFRNLRRGNGGADAAGKPQNAAEFPIADLISRALSEPSRKGAPGEPAQTEQTQAAVNEDETAGQSTAAPINPRPDHLLINQWEQDFMKQLHELIPSPRATKRFINIYRLIRASVDLDDKLRLEDFNGKDGPGKYRPVLLLLAILTGYPDQATEILRELLERKPSATWWEFIDSFKSRAEKAPAAVNGSAPTVAEPEAATAKTANSSGADEAATANPKPNGTSDNATVSDPAQSLSDAADAESWRQLLEKLENLRHLFPAQSCADFVEWAPKVARYSFQSGRVLLTRGVREPQQKTGVD